MEFSGDRPIQYIHVDGDGAQPVDSSVIVEQSVALTVNGDVWMEFMCTPIDLEALAVGFLYNERIIDSLSEVVDVRVCEHRDNVDVWLDHTAEKPRSWRRTSGCTGGVTAVLAERGAKHLFQRLGGNPGSDHPPDPGYVRSAGALPSLRRRPFILPQRR